MNNNPTFKALFPKAPEVPLEFAPLVAVIAQVRFEPILAMQTNLAPFQEAIRDQYPMFRSGRVQETAVNVDAIRLSKSSIWQFSDLKEQWKVTLSTGFLSLQTTNYESRNDFLKKFETLLRALTKHFNPGVLTRTGIRYIDKLTGDALGNISRLVRSELVGIIGADVERSVSASLTETVFHLFPNQLLVRSGRLPPHSSPDSSLITPDEKSSWVLDIDCSNSAKRPWKEVDIISEFKELAEVSYNFFRWAITKDFLTHFGGRA